MKYYRMHAQDPALNCCLLFKPDPSDGVLRLRPEFRALACPKCGKVDELKALQTGIREGIDIRSKRDVVVTADDIDCVSERVAELIRSEGVKGATLIPIRGGAGFSVLWPTLVADTNRESSGMRLTDQCEVCGRFCLANGFPLIQSLRLPSIEKCVFRSSIGAENPRHQLLTIYADQPVVDLFKKARVKGVYYTKLEEPLI